MIYFVCQWVIEVEEIRNRILYFYPDVEIYNDEVIYCRSYISKHEAEEIAKETWQMYEQKQVVKEGM